MGEGKRPSAEAETRKAKKWEGNAGPSSLVVHVARPENIMERENNVPDLLRLFLCDAFSRRMSHLELDLEGKRHQQQVHMAKGEFFFNQN